ncbi:MAG TPA: SDR family oxidoreductase [Gemmatimonadaceae bacterium]|nr:SDR family oxidoreductase [Gemmatimonadaceae bacterium]
MLLVTGASGFLGANVLSEALAHGREVVAAYYKTPIRNERVRSIEFDLTQPGAGDELIEEFAPEWVLNCAALANVDQCEGDPDLAFRLNVDLPRLLAESCHKANVGFLHVSTDSVFDGQRGGYDEDDPAAPLNVYARTKLEGERAVFDKMLEALVVRTNFVGYSVSGKTGLVEWIIRELKPRKRISGFTDVVFAPLVANDLARIMFAMMDAKLKGLYHVNGSTPVTKFDFARKLARELDLDESLVNPARLADAKLEAPRPLNTSLSSKRVESDLGRQMPDIDETIRRLGELGPETCSRQLAQMVGL